MQYEATFKCLELCRVTGLWLRTHKALTVLNHAGEPHLNVTLFIFFPQALPIAEPVRF